MRKATISTLSILALFILLTGLGLYLKNETLVLVGASVALILMFFVPLIHLKYVKEDLVKQSKFTALIEKFFYFHEHNVMKIIGTHVSISIIILTIFIIHLFIINLEEIPLEIAGIYISGIIMMMSIIFMLLTSTKQRFERYWQPTIIAFGVIALVLYFLPQKGLKSIQDLVVIFTIFIIAFYPRKEQFRKSIIYLYMLLIAFADLTFIVSLFAILFLTLF